METIEDPATAGGAPVRAAPRVYRKSGPAAGGTDKVLLVLLGLLNVGSAYTTIVGARQVLPWPMSDVIGVAVQAMLFLTLAGLAARHAPVRKWLVVAVFAAASVYTSFFAYYDQLAGFANGQERLDLARQAHASFVSDAWQPVQGEAERLEGEAAQLFDLAEREGSSGVTTGVVGFGPVARQLAEEARQTELAAASVRSDLERLQDRFEYSTEGLDAEGIYLADLGAWQMAPAEWKERVSKPDRAAYVDTEQEVALLTPYWKVKRGELPAMASLVLAMVVDGTSILLGTAISARRRPWLDTATDGAVRWIAGARGASVAVRSAWDGDLDGPADPAALDPALVMLRVTGRGSDFVGAVYEAVHPGTRTLDAPVLLDHDERSWRIAARVLLDRLVEVGWVQREGVRWRVVRYEALTSWLAEQYRVACEAEATAVEPPDEGLLLLPG